MSTDPGTITIAFMGHRIPAQVEPTWHHSHYVSRTDDGDTTSYVFRPFALRADRPDMPEGWRDLPREQFEPIDAEVRAATIAWKMSQHSASLAELIADARPYAQQFVIDHQAVTAAYAALEEAPDGQWRATVTRLVKAHEAVKRSAGDWFPLREELDDAQFKHGEGVLDACGGWIDVAGRMGLDVRMWTAVDSQYDLDEQLRRQMDTVRRVGQLAGDGPGAYQGGSQW